MNEKGFRDLSWNKPHSSIVAIKLRHLSIRRLLRLEGNCLSKNDSSHGQLYNTRELRLVNKCSAKGKEEECQPVIVKVRRELQLHIFKEDHSRFGPKKSSTSSSSRKALLTRIFSRVVSMT
ncbi:hypothetical protein MtrunA17_Chr3g0085181 [Medicago truncatula]|uniref:Uncharacterized protein n=1 Tax=Medicago truncatula TaxID=3880 RepID=A0A396IMU8_MEDTR|nr:hypothetical protein MtrunA17_Chr3g0085181 [Medicago truncatula]